MTKVRLTDITVHLVQQTERAILVCDSDDLDKAVWLPKSQVEFQEIKPGIVEVTLPEWLATERGLV